MEIIIVAAMALNRVIGLHGKIPWAIPEELKMFKRFTVGFPMIMGRKTFDSLPGLLPDRQHIVLSRNTEYEPKGALHARSMVDALNFCAESDRERISIIGGEQIFREGLKFATKIRLTTIERSFTGDTFFPPISVREFEHISKQTSRDGDEPFEISTYVRV